MACFKWLILTIATSTFITGVLSKSVNCTEGTDCVLNCDDNYECQYATIDATKATSLILNCGTTTESTEYDCRDTRIKIPESTTASTTITCSQGYVCQGMNIYYDGDATSTPSTQSLNLICNGEANSCIGTNVYANNAGQFSFTCDEADCESMELNVNNVGTVDINCMATPNSGTNYGVDGCDEVVINAIAATTVNVNCTGGPAGCIDVNINATSAETVNVYAGPDGFLGSTNELAEIHCEEVGTLCQIVAVGNGTSNYGLLDVKIYPPASDSDLSKFSLKCYGTGCRYFKLYRSAGFASIANADIKFNGCLQCYDRPGEFCIDQYQIRCGDYGNSNYAIISNDWVGGELGTCDSRWNSGTACDCTTMASVFESAFYVDSTDEYCILPPNTIQCDTDSECSIDCVTQDCATNVIDGTQASSLTVSCGGVDACRGTKIYPPTATGTSADITCGAWPIDDINDNDYACYGNDDLDGMGYFLIMGDDAYDLTVKAYPSFYGTLGGAQSAIYARDVQNSFELACIGNYTSRDWLYGSYNRYACSAPNVYITETDADLSKYTIGCYGTGCADLRLNKADGFTNIADANVKLNGCGQCYGADAETEGDEIVNCFAFMYMVCDACSLSGNGITCVSFPRSDDNLGCLDSGSNQDVCGCAEASEAFVASYDNDLTDSNCILLPGVEVPTTTTKPADGANGFDMMVAILFGMLMVINMSV